MNFVFLMDPLHTVIYEKDTTFVLMLESHRVGHDVYFLPNGGMTRVNGKTHFHVVKVIPQQNPAQLFLEHGSVCLGESDIHAIFIRTDPPFDSQYLMNTWLLDLVSANVTLINNPVGIRTVNEKVWASQFTSIVPPTLIGRNRKDLLEFLSNEKEIIAKPTDGHGGKAVFYIKSGDANANVILETLTEHWRKDIVLQRYIPESVNGDKRILLLNGEPLGAVLRVHGKDDHRNNFFAGGKPQATEITKRDLEIIRIISPELKNLGLYFVGIDIIGDYLVEVNVTSPTGIQEMNRLYNTQLEEKVINFVEKLIEHNNSIDKISA